MAEEGSEASDTHSVHQALKEGVIQESFKSKDAALLGKVEEWTSKAKPSLQDPIKSPGPVTPGPVLTRESVRDSFKNELEDLDILESMDGFTVRPKRYLGGSWATLNTIAKSLGGKWMKTTNPRDCHWKIL